MPQATCGEKAEGATCPGRRSAQRNQGRPLGPHSRSRRAVALHPRGGKGPLWFQSLILGLLVTRLRYIYPSNKWVLEDAAHHSPETAPRMVTAGAVRMGDAWHPGTPFLLLCGNVPPLIHVPTRFISRGTRQPESTFIPVL